MKEGIASPVTFRPPPMKKQRGGATPEVEKPGARVLDKDASDAIARRRQELARLQSSFQHRPNFGTSPTTKPAVYGSAPPLASPPSPAGNAQSTTSLQPPSRSLPPHQRFVQARKSDIFPTVPKSTASAEDGQLAAMAAAATAVTAQEQAAAFSSNVARRLDDNFEKDSNGKTTRAPPPPTRPSSAPPRRPPPPPPPPPSSGGAPSLKLASRADKKGSQPQPPKKASTNSSSMPRSYTGRPDPITPNFQNKKGGQNPLQPSTQNAPPPSAAPPTLPETAKIGAPPVGPPRSDKSSSAPPQRVAFDSSPVSPVQKKATFAATPSTPPLSQASNHGVTPNTDGSESSDRPTTKFAGATPFMKASATAGHTPYRRKSESTAGQTPFPTKKESTAGHTPFPAKNETTAGHTPFPAKNETTAGHTPFPAKNEFMAGHTPFSKAQPDNEEDLPSARKDMLMGMRSVADSPVRSGSSHRQENMESSAELRLQKELAQLQKEKRNALRELAKREEELEKLKREHNQVPPQNVGFLSPLAPASLPMSPTSAVLSPFPTMQQGLRRRRMPTPHPKKRSPFMNGSENSVDVQKEQNQEDLLPFLTEAVAHVPFEYETETASFVVRRPYGSEKNQNLWFDNGQVGAKIYQNQATAHKVESVEVVALIPVDDSKLLLYGADSVRHGTREGAWQDFPNGEDEKPLGNITYIDSEANECMYSLDSLYQSAAAVRELYCNSLLSTAIGLQQKQREEPALQPEPVPHLVPPSQTQENLPQPLPQQPPVSPPKVVETADACVDTEGLLQPETKPSNHAEPPPSQVAAPPQKPLPSPPPPPVEGSDGSVIGMFANMIASLLWLILIELPWRIFSTILTMVIAVGLLALLWMYFSEPYRQYSLGGLPPVGHFFNPAGIV